LFDVSAIIRHKNGRRFPCRQTNTDFRPRAKLYGKGSRLFRIYRIPNIGNTIGKGIKKALEFREH